MFETLLNNLFKPEVKVPADFERMVRLEYRNVPMDYVEHFVKTNNRLPSQQELLNAI